MGYLSWTKAWSSSDNGTVLTGAHLGTVQSDITGVLNGGLSNTNVATLAAILESKLAFNTSSGHDHDGSNSKAIAASTFIGRHYRSGAFVTRTAAGTLSVSPGHVEIGGTVYNLTTATTLTLATAGDWVFGSETSNAPAYVYAYNNGGALGFKLSTEPPDLSDTSDNTTESPWRYQLYSSAYYRCVGAVWNNASGDIDIGTETSFDASSVRPFRITGNGAGITIPTIWTPDTVVAFGASVDATPAAGEVFGDQIIASRQLATDFSLNIDQDNGAFRALTDTWASTDGGGIVIVAQAAGTGGGLTFTACTAGLFIYGYALCGTRF